MEVQIVEEERGIGQIVARWNRSAEELPGEKVVINVDIGENRRRALEIVGIEIALDK